MKKPKSIFLLKEEFLSVVYSESAIAEICDITENDGRVHTAEEILKNPEYYQDVEIIFSGWNAPVLNAELLHALPSLKAFFYGAGTVRYFVTDAFWERNIRLTSAYTANAIPVAEYTMASIVFALKRAWTKNYALRQGRIDHASQEVSGVYTGSRVGIISLGAIGRLICQRLSQFELDVVAYDPFASESLFQELSVRRVPTLEALFSGCDVVSLHAPKLPETEGMITGELLQLMPRNATFINTSRGAIVDENALVRVLKNRPDIFAVLDVITDETAYCTTPLLTLPNVFLTPHIAGSAGRECHRLGDMAREECHRYLAGEPALVPVTPDNIVRMA
ncbi:hydroxyacid dehydrogenase [Ruficoccus amylovorans]|uniref:Hydroxyacid dehydrogenase n=1 Tax=Ruficoccus amylovorans TaxID=1804625 RepID=A0A842HDX3_9BACT|nr:hydroxyacid dehydrogenase [Ruficoccus amylovorans]MBC2593734.1 hydroxyacid dehydrogenase [Ruficoccus amylovorans]